MFLLRSTDDGRQQPWEYLPCSEIAPKYGMAMKMSSGTLAQSGSADGAEYISVREEAAALAEGTPIPVVKVLKDQVWQTEVESTEGLTVGEGYDLDTDGLSIAATSEGGACFVVTAVDETTGIVLGRFRDPAAAADDGGEG